MLFSRMRLLCILTLLGNLAQAQIKLNSIEREAAWNNVKLHNFYLRWEHPTLHSSGVIFKAFDNTGDTVLMLEALQKGNVSLLLPLSTGNRIVYTTPIPSTHFPIEFTLSIGDYITIATSRCELALHIPMPPTEFRISTPFIDLGSVPNFKDVDTHSVGSGNPLLHACSLYKNLAPVPLIEEQEPEHHTLPESEEIVLEESGASNGCEFEGQTYHVGEYQVTSESCTECICQSNGNFKCSKMNCPVSKCGMWSFTEELCCSHVCPKQCEYNNRIHHHGSVFWPKKCVRCECNDGEVDCGYNKKNECPVLPCPKEKQKFVGSECCPTCVDFDYCSVKPCNEDASCTSTEYGAKCRCNEGFFGNGTYCYDIDECSFDASAREQLGGCGIGTICVNTKGSFRCDCLPGHPRIDERNCLDLIRV